MFPSLHHLASQYQVVNGINSSFCLRSDWKLNLWNLHLTKTRKSPNTTYTTISSNHKKPTNQSNQMMTSACAPWSRTRNKSWRSETVKVKHFGSLGFKICCIGFWDKFHQISSPKWSPKMEISSPTAPQKIQPSTTSTLPFPTTPPRLSLQILWWLRAHQSPGLCLEGMTYLGASIKVKQDIDLQDQIIKSHADHLWVICGLSVGLSIFVSKWL